MPTDALIPLVERVGALAILAAIVWYVGRTVVPKVFASYERLVDKFDAALERRDSALTEMGGVIGGKIDGLGGKVDHLAGAVDHLRTDLDTHIDGGCKPRPHPKG